MLCVRRCRNALSCVEQVGESCPVVKAARENNIMYTDLRRPKGYLSVELNCKRAQLVGVAAGRCAGDE